MGKWLAGLAVFLQRKMLVILGFGFVSGLPLLLTKDTLQAWLTSQGLAVDQVVLLSLVGLPYSLKFLWSPLVDRFVPPVLGRRRGWILLMQIGMTVAIALMAGQNPKDSLQWLAILALVVSLLSATQDIGVDAYRADILLPHEAGAGAGMAVLGYRIALLTTGTVAFALADRVGWQTVYGLLAGLMGLTVLITLWGENPPNDSSAPVSLVDAVWQPLAEFWQRLGGLRALLVLLFVLLYRLGDSLVAIVTIPFLQDFLQFSQTDIGLVRGAVGLTATIAGTLVGGAILSQLGIYRSLWLFGILQGATNFAYWVLAGVGHNLPLIIVTINIENFCTGMGTAAFVGFLLTMCNPTFSATQYAVLSSLVAFSRDVMVAPAGFLVKAIGWHNFFLGTIAAAVPALLLLTLFAPANTINKK
ncbi:MAG: AmpG family muropeptide MFS transporter [Pseudanabaenaceae cyanobacterium]